MKTAKKKPLVRTLDFSFCKTETIYVMPRTEGYPFVVIEINRKYAIKDFKNRVKGIQVCNGANGEVWLFPLKVPSILANTDASFVFDRFFQECPDILALYCLSAIKHCIVEKGKVCSAL